MVAHFASVHSQLMSIVIWPLQDSGGAKKYRLAMFSGNREQKIWAEDYQPLRRNIFRAVL